MKARTAGGIETVVKVINVHIENADVCKFGCAALGNMTAGISGKCTHNKQRQNETNR